MTKTLHWIYDFSYAYTYDFLKQFHVNVYQKIIQAKKNQCKKDCTMQIC